MIKKQDKKSKGQILLNVLWAAFIVIVLLNPACNDNEAGNPPVTPTENPPTTENSPTENPPLTVTAENLSISLEEDLSVDFVLKIVESNNQPIKYTVTKNPEFGTLQGISPALTYVPFANFHGSDSFNFEASGETTSSQGTVSIVVNPVNDAPTANTATLTTDEDTIFTGILSASDLDGNPLAYSIVSQGSKGVATITNASTGAYTYKPNTNANGSDSFTFRVSDGAVNSNLATISITIKPINDPPIANNGSLTTNEDTSKSGMLTGSDPEASLLTFSIISNGSKGSAVITNSSTGAFTYTPNANSNGLDSFQFKVRDGSLDSNVATVFVTINPVNDAPVASNGNLNTDEDKQVTGKLNASDHDGNSLTFSIVNQPSKGTILNLNAAIGDYVYFPNANATGSDSFTFRANDGVVNSNTATITVNLNASNDPPVTSNSSISTNEDTVHTGTLSGSDPDGDALFYSLESNPINGTAVITNTATGAFKYTPNANANGSDSFTFKVRDGSVDSNIATVFVTISPVNDAPVANNGSLTVDEDTAKSGTLTASDIDSASLTYSIISNGSKGSAVITNTSTGAFTYMPNANATGSESFTFRVSDGSLNSNTATISVTISYVNDAPVANNGSLITDEDIAKLGTLSASDIDGSSLAYSIVSNGSKGSAVITNTSTGAFTYTPNANANGGDSFTFKVRDGSLDSNIATVSVTINVVNDAPQASDQSITLTQNAPVTVILSAIDLDGDNLTYLVVTPPLHGTFVANGRNIIYTPNTDYFGGDIFTFKANDGTIDSNISTVLLNVSSLLCQGSQSSTFSAGAGTSGNPYLICTAQQLSNIRNFTSSYFIIGASFDYSNPTYFSIPTFSGNLDGKDFEISATNGLSGGIFTTSNNATISNLRVKKISVSGFGVVGTIVGSSTGTTLRHISISDCLVQAGASDQDDQMVGGLIGFANQVTILQSDVSCSVGAVGKHNVIAGGFVGSGNYNLTIRDSSFSSKVSASATGQYAYAGGFVGSGNGSYPQGLLDIQNSYVSGQGVLASSGSGYSYAGAIVGELTHASVVLYNNYSSTSVSAIAPSYAFSGGIIGSYAHGLLDIQNSYVSGQGVLASSGSGYSYAGGIVGESTHASVVLYNNYSSTSVSAIAPSYAFSGGIIGSSTFYSTEENRLIGAGVFSAGFVTSSKGLIGQLTQYGGVFANLSGWAYPSCGTAPASTVVCTEVSDIRHFYSSTNAPLNTWDFVDEMRNGNNDVWTFPSTPGLPILNPLRTSTNDDSLVWKQFPFFSNSYQGTCAGTRYVKFNSTYNLWVGIVLCDSDRYKILLSTGKSSYFYEVADEAGNGQDHCELVNPDFRLPNEDSITSGGCTTCALGPFLRPNSTPYYIRDYFGEQFRSIGSGFTPEWYNCGFSFP